MDVSHRIDSNTANTDEVWTFRIICVLWKQRYITKAFQASGAAGGFSVLRSDGRQTQPTERLM
eukprot:scaffold109307_cov19-Prasinocladus_malaysianus.AAC.1